MKQALQRYSHILSADDHYTSWQEVVLSFLNYYVMHKVNACLTLLCNFFFLFQLTEKSDFFLPGFS